MSEVNAAFGLLQLKHFEQAQQRRADIDALYRSRLAKVPGLLLPPPPSIGTSRNYSYFPIRVTANCAISRDDLFQRLKDEGIFGRRYFYPLISEFPMYRQLPSADPAGLPVSFSVSRQVICLPIYPDLPDEQVHRIADVLTDAIGERLRETPTLSVASGLLASVI
jgi:dTDP-4-amino-4,6-dideoxygalactose transaminase